jgi:hypothetical protein
MRMWWCGNVPSAKSTWNWAPNAQNVDRISETIGLFKLRENIFT